jgi:hypothetical protein
VGFVASTALAVSGIGPSCLADGVTALLLFGLHFVTAVVVIVGFMRTLPARARPGGGVEPALLVVEDRQVE